MNPIGNTADLSRNGIVRWSHARQFMDTRFQTLRQKALMALDRSPYQQHWGPIAETKDWLGQAVFLKILKDAWERAVADLKRELLPQVSHGRKYRPVKTVNPEGKTKVRKSWAWKRTRGRLRSQVKTKRSHHKGVYVTTRKPGRPPLPAFIKAKRDAEKARRAAARKARREHRAAMKAERAQRWAKIVSVRGLLSIANAVTPRSLDTRDNHDPEWAYMAPARGTRQRRTPAQVRLWGTAKKPKPGKGGRAGAGIILAARAARAAITRSLHLRGYWRQVKRLAGEK